MHQRLRVERAVGRRHLLVVAAATVVLVVVPLSVAAPLPTPAPVAWFVAVALVAVLGGTTVATYVPPRGHGLRDAVGCTPCAIAPAMAVPASVILLSTAPHDVATALLALALVVAAAGRRLATAGQACPTS